MPIDSALAYQAPREVWWYGWLAAAYHAAYGDTALARKWSEQLGSLDRGRARYDFPGALRADIQARLAARRGDIHAALPLAQRAHDLWIIHTENTSESYPEIGIRYLLARLRRANGQADSSEVLFRSLSPPTAWFGPYSALASLELGELLEARRAFAESAAAYRFALLYWTRGGRDIDALRQRATEGLSRVSR